MEPVNVHEAKTHLSKLLERVEMGEEVTLAKAGRPIAKLVPVPPKVDRRRPGTARGIIRVGDDFEDPLPNDILDAFG